MRTYVPAYRDGKPYLSEVEVFRRTVRAIKTIASMPPAVMQRVRSNWPKEFDFHAEAIRLAMTPGARVENKKIVRAIKKLRYTDFDDLNLDGETVSNMANPHSGMPPTAEAISDCIIAGEWFAKLALLPENAEEFVRCVDRYRIGKAKTPQVDDQRFLTLYSQGWSLRLIGQRFGINEHQAERRLFEIARNLWRIAHNTAVLIDIETKKKQMAGEAVA